MSNGEDEFHAAVRQNDRSAVEKYLHKGVDINCVYYAMTPLHVAITKDHTDLAAWLIGQGADVKKSEINGKTTPFEEAVVRDQVQVVKMLGRQGVDVNQVLSSGHTALTLAASRKLTYLSQTLVDAGADVNLPNSCGETALWLSARDGHTGVVELLIKAGAKRDEQLGDDHLTPLLYSVINEHLPTTKLLVQAGCDLNIKDDGGWTALWHAVSNSNEHLVRALLAGRADMTVTDSDGKTLLEEATENEDDDIMRLLKSAAR